MIKLLKNKMYLATLIGVLLNVISLITLFFVLNQTYFTIIFILNIMISFGLSSYVILSKEETNSLTKMKLTSLYLFITLFFLIMDIIVISNTWDMNVYANLMYVTNVKLYCFIYSIYVLIMILFSLYIHIKEICLINNEVRQKSTKE